MLESAVIQARNGSRLTPNGKSRFQVRFLSSQQGQLMKVQPTTTRQQAVLLIGVRAICAGCALLLIARSPSWADDRPRPSVLITKQHVVNAKKLIAEQEWAAELYQDVHEAAVSGTITQKGRVYDGNHVAQGVVYQVEGNKELAARAKNRLLAFARRFKPGGTYHWGVPVDHAITYDLIADACTPEERRQIEDYLRRLANEAIKWKRTRSTTPNMSFVCHWTVGVTGYAIGDNDIIRWALHDDHDGKPVTGGLFPVMESALRDKCLWLEAPIYGTLAFYGMLMMAEAEKNSRGTDLYNAPAKNGATIRKIVDGLFSMAYPIERTGMPGGSVRQITWGHVSTHGPGIDHQHGGHVDPFYVNKPDARPDYFNLYHIFTIANHLQPDPRYEWLLGLNPWHNEPVGTDVWSVWFPWALFYTDVGRGAQQSPPAMPSVVYPEMGLAILRADESPTYWTSGKPVLVHQTGEPYGHADYDHMQIMLFANGRLLYHSPDQRPYSDVGLAPQRFNKVVVDRRPNSWSDGRSKQRFEFSPDVKFLTNTASGLNPGVTEVRSLFLTDEYAADFYDLTSDAEHTYDWFIHAIGKGQFTHASLYTSSTDFATDYPWIEHERKWETDAAVRVDFTQRAAGVIKGIGSWTDAWLDDFAGVRMTLLGQPGTTAYACDDLIGYEEVAWGRRQQSTPTFCARRLARNTTYVALHEPYANSPKLSVRRFGRDSQAHAIRIEGPDFVDVVCTAFDDGSGTHVLGDVTGTQKVAFNNYAWIRIANGTVTARGGIHAFLLSAPELAGQATLMVNGKSESYARSGDYVSYREDAPANPALTAIAPRDDVPRRVGPGETFRIEVVVANPTDVQSPPHQVGLTLPEGWKVSPEAKDVSLPAGRRHTAAFEVTVPREPKAGTVYDVQIWLESMAGAESNRRTFPAGRLAVTRPIVVQFESESLRLPKNGTGSVRLSVSNPTGYAVRGEVKITGSGRTTVAPPQLTFGPIPPGGKVSHELTVEAGGKDELGELKAELVRIEMVGQDDGVALPRETVGVPPASLLVSVGVTICEDVRHKLPYSAHYPVWIVRSPTYEIWFSQQHGLARTMFDSTGRSIYAYPWGGPSGLCRFSRVVDGVDRIVHGAGETKSIQWQGTTLVCGSPFGDTIEIQCTEHHVRWHVRSPTPQSTGLGYRLHVEAFHAHPPSFTAVHSDNDQRPTDWPAKVGSLSYGVVRQPGYSTDSIWIAATGIVPRCTMFDNKHKHPHGHKGILVHSDWLKRPEFDLYIGFAPDGEVLRRIKDAAGVD